VNVPLSWLRELVDDLPDAAGTAELLDGLGLSVEAVHERPGAPDGVVVAEVAEAERIEGSDHLWRVIADDGAARHEVVCGAPNVRVGMRSALALPGAHLPAVGLTVEAREVMGVPSRGMLCSPKELGLYDWAGGLIAFADDVALGAPLATAWPAETVLELELTPNRADAFSVLGVARDLAAKLDRPLRHPAAGETLGDEDGDDGLSVEVADPEGCPQLVLQRIDDVAVGPSPVWLQRRLAALGLRPRNNVVDVTNYVTYELGQPSHAYDLRVLEGGRLQVRPARAGEEVELLDGETYRLETADQVIATPTPDGGSKAVGLAGVMGGLHDSVRADTSSVALEVAHFDPVRVRKTAKRHGLHTDAHLRFERGVDPALPPAAAAHAARLIAAVAGGTVHPAASRAGGSGDRPEIAFRPSRVAFLMAFDVPAETQRRYLRALGCEVREDARDDEAREAGIEAWRVRPPSWRFDLTIEEDLIEEVARLHGYEHVGATRPDLPFTPRRDDPTHRALRDELAAAGLQETIAYVFTGDDELARAHAPEARVALSNPQGVERSKLRTALHPGLLAAASHNRGEPGLALFEIGRTFLEQEEERLGLLLSGAWERGVWREGTSVDFWRLAGLVESLAERRRADVTFRPAQAEEAPMLHPGVAAVVLWNGREIGVAGRLHPEVAAAYELSDVHLAELALPLEARRLAVGEIARQPYAERDLAIVAPREVPYATLEGLVTRAAGERLVEAFPFDVYQGAPLGEEERSVALRLRWRHPSRALRDEEVDGRLAEVIDAVRAAGYEIRG
jgi:phenylalanyl-tRNA synthetase beta chain